MQLLKVKDVASRLGHSAQTVRNLIARGLLECYRCPGVRISEAQLAAYLTKAQRRNETRKHPPPSATQSIRHLDADRLREAWKEQGID